MKESDFIKHYIANSAQMMWFLGAGTSRTAGMPTATDIIWDLKVKYYCREENQDIKNHDVNNDHIKNKVQSFMDSKGFPNLWSPEEYSFYFDLTFGDDYLSQQKYLSEQLNRDRVSLNIGHRALAGLISMNKAKIIFTTNFDEVIETACVKVAQTNIPTFQLDGSYAALDALNSEQFPIYAKIHGDFKYRNVKNLTDDLLSNDEQIQRCVIAASARYGMIVTGYSGRDKNVMEMLTLAVEQQNAFPSGLFWMVSDVNRVEPSATEFVEYANSKGVKAYIVETATFDTLLSKIWRQIENKPDDLCQRVITNSTIQTKIPLSSLGSSYPVIRTNALQITSLPSRCAIIKTTKEFSHIEVKELLQQNKSKAVVARAETLVAWGSNDEIKSALGAGNVVDISEYLIESPSNLISESTLHRSFFERALVVGLCDGKPLQMRNNYGFILAIDSRETSNVLFQPLRDALSDYSGNPGSLSGNVPYSTAGTRWTEGIKLKLEVRNKEVYLMINPTIVIEPSSERKNHQDFVKKRISKRYNVIASKILDAWISILLGSTGKGEANVVFGNNTDYPAEFKISTRTTYTRK